MDGKRISAENAWKVAKEDGGSVEIYVAYFDRIQGLIAEAALMGLTQIRVGFPLNTYRKDFVIDIMNVFKAYGYRVTEKVKDSTIYYEINWEK